MNLLRSHMINSTTEKQERLAAAGWKKSNLTDEGIGRKELAQEVGQVLTGECEQNAYERGDWEWAPASHCRNQEPTQSDQTPV